MHQLNENAGQTQPSASSSACTLPPLVIVGNKCDKGKERVISSSESLTILAGRPFCDFIETSALLNANVDEAFIRLFELAHLPPEMSPALHRKVTPSYDGSGRNKGLFGFVNRKVSEACGAIHPNPRRPSVATDLMKAQGRGSSQKWKNSSLSKSNKKVSKCVIQ